MTSAGLMPLSVLKVRLLDLVGSLWARANLHPVLGGVHALAPLEAVQYPVKTHTRHHFSSVVVTHTRTLNPKSNTSNPPAGHFHLEQWL